MNRDKLNNEKLKVTEPKPKSWNDKLLTPWVIQLVFGLVFLLVSWLIYYLFITVSSVNKPDEIRVDNFTDSNQNTSLDVKLYDSIKDVPNVPEGTFNYGGAVLFASLTTQGLNEAISAAHPNFRLRYTEPRDGKPGGRKGLAMLLNGELSFAQRAAALSETDYNKVEKRGFSLKQIPVAIDGIIFYTHRDISIPGLNVKQLQDIYKGKLTNWKQVGGPDEPIVPFVMNPKVADLLNVLVDNPETGQLSTRVQFVRDYTDAIRQVASTPGGISFGGSGPIVGQQTIRPLAIAKANSKEYVQPLKEDGKQINAEAMRNGSYPISRRLFIAFRQDGTIDQSAGEAYANMLMSKEGQQIVKKAGFVPFR
jgi:phosphate transport system substrate-binding protein